MFRVSSVPPHRVVARSNTFRESVLKQLKHETQRAHRPHEIATTTTKNRTDGPLRTRRQRLRRRRQDQRCRKWRRSTSKAMRSIPNGTTPSSHGTAKPQVQAFILRRHPTSDPGIRPTHLGCRCPVRNRTSGRSRLSSANACGAREPHLALSKERD